LLVQPGVEVSTLLLRPERTFVLLALGHGAGAGMRQEFFQEITGRLADRGVTTFRYQFPYMERGSRRPDPTPFLLATVRAAVAKAAETIPDLPLFAGGKSMGGRITSMAAARGEIAVARGLVFLGYPLHAASKPPEVSERERSAHLPAISVPMLFLQGTNDKFAGIESMRTLCARLGERTQLHVIEGADHSYHVPKRTGRTDAEVLDELADVVTRWIRERI
jgi:predicted alpha/beta-hydrolase family hydrolase